MTEPIPPQILNYLASRSRGCMLRVDGMGRIHERNCCPDSTLPEDIRGAASLDTCLSRSVRIEWIELIRDVICSNQPIESLMVLDGLGIELVLLPWTGVATERGGWILLLPLAAPSSPMHGSSRRTLRNHEWGALDVLSRCQLDTLRHVTLGLSNQQIASVMHRSKRAVEWHIRHLHRLLGAGTRECMARLGRSAGLDRFRDEEWANILATRPARRSLEEFALSDSGGRAA